MGASKKGVGELAKLFAAPTSSEADRQRVEQLKQRLNELLRRDPRAARKAALVLERWLRQGPKSK